MGLARTRSPRCANRSLTSKPLSKNRPTESTISKKKRRRGSQRRSRRRTRRPDRDPNRRRKPDPQGHLDRWPPVRKDHRQGRGEGQRVRQDRGADQRSRRRSRSRWERPEWLAGRRTVATGPVDRPVRREGQRGPERESRARTSSCSTSEGTRNEHTRRTRRAKLGHRHAAQEVGRERSL